MNIQTEKSVIVLHPDDNILVSCRHLHAGEELIIDETMISVISAIPLGHKVASRTIERGAKVIKNGASIGSAITIIQPGEHVHLHNLTSDYIASHTRQHAQKVHRSEQED